jgi:tRNA-dependent cyclodipeptide synthase
MNLKIIRGGSVDDFYAKKYTLGIGISLGNKWFTPENIVSLIEWSLPHTKDKLIIYVADQIHAINLEVRNRLTYEKALKKARTAGSEILNNIKKLAESKFSERELDIIIYANWEDLANKTYQDKVSFLYQLYKDNDNFAKHIDNLIKDYTKKEKRVFTSEEITRLSNYILEELPECLCRVPIHNLVCDAYIYPTDGPLAIFVEQLQFGKIFPEIREKILDTDPKALIIAN